MEVLFAGSIILLLIGAGVLSARLCCYRRQLSHMLSELQVLEENEETNLFLTSAVKIGKTQEVISSMNRILEQSRRNRERIVRENRNYREGITSISHDIRTPLTSARGYMQMLRKENVTEEKRLSYARIVERRLDDLAGLLDQLFLYARIEAGEESFLMEDVNVGNLFADTISLFYEDFGERNYEPEIFMEQSPCHIRADKQAVRRIMENLIKNSLVHGTGGWQMSLKRQEGSGQEKVLIRISNTTKSIERADIERIFDRFYTSDTSRSSKRTGLGLSIVKELTQRMGGEVRAELNGEVFFVEVEFPNTL